MNDKIKDIPEILINYDYIGLLHGIYYWLSLCFWILIILIGFGYLLFFIYFWLDFYDYVDKYKEKIRKTTEYRIYKKIWLLFCVFNLTMISGIILEWALNDYKPWNEYFWLEADIRIGIVLIIGLTVLTILLLWKILKLFYSLILDTIYGFYPWNINKTEKNEELINNIREKIVRLESAKSNTSIIDTVKECNYKLEVLYPLLEELTENE